VIRGTPIPFSAKSRGLSAVFYGLDITDDPGHFDQIERRNLRRPPACAELVVPVYSPLVAIIYPHCGSSVASKVP
jgi:hypothetical protein